MTPGVHRIRWKGRTDGPFSREEIRTRLAEGELSLLHRIEVDGRWMSLGEFLNGASAHSAHPGRPVFIAPAGEELAARARETRENLHKLGYFLCGLCFVLPFPATAGALLAASRLNRMGDHVTAKTQTALATVFTLLGLVFWAAVFIAHARGLI